MRSKEDFKAKKDAAVNELTKNIEELEVEKDSIMNCASQFGSFLKNNALIPYNDAFKDYIDMLIYDEKSKTGNTINWKQIRKLEKDKKIYEQKKNVLDKSLQNSKENYIKEEAIFRMRDDLVNLKHNGRALKDALGNTYKISP